MGTICKTCLLHMQATVIQPKGRI